MAREEILSVIKSNKFTKICWFGRIQHTPKQSHYVRRPALNMFCITLCGSRTENVWRPWARSFRV